MRMTTITSLAEMQMNIDTETTMFPAMLTFNSFAVQVLHVRANFPEFFLAFVTINFPQICLIISITFFTDERTFITKTSNSQ